MEGLIPLVYKRIKRGVSHRHYKCLSTTGGADFYVSGFDDGGDHLSLGEYYHRSPPMPETRRASDVSDGRFRRRSSSLPRIRHVEDRRGGFGGDYLDPDPTRKRELAPFRSHRRMFSCITG